MTRVDRQTLTELNTLVADLSRRLERLDDTEEANSLPLRIARAHVCGLADQLEAIVLARPVECEGRAMGLRGAPSAPQ